MLDKTPEFEEDTPYEDLSDDTITTVCFTGHRGIPESKRDVITAMLDEVLLGLYDRGARIFKTGGAVGFDTLAAFAVLNLKKRFGVDSVHLYLCLPAPNQTMKFNESQKADYDCILSLSDGVTYACERCTTDSYFKRNRELVKSSDVCVAYCTKQRGGTYFTCKQALLSGVEFINIADLIV